MSEKSRTPPTAVAAGVPNQPADWPAALALHERWLRLAVVARLEERDAVEEVMQEVALATLSSRSTPSKLANVGAWLYQLAVRQALLYRRKQGRRHRLELRHAAIEPAEKVSPEADPLSWLIKTERLQLVREALTRLPPRDAEIMLLKYAENSTAAQISDRLAISVSAVEARLHRARARLRAELARAEIAEVTNKADES